MNTPSPNIPYLASEVFGAKVYLNNLPQLTDSSLNLLIAECESIVSSIDITLEADPSTGSYEGSEYASWRCKAQHKRALVASMLHAAEREYTLRQESLRLKLTEAQTTLLQLQCPAGTKGPAPEAAQPPKPALAA